MADHENGVSQFTYLAGRTGFFCLRPEGLRVLSLIFFLIWCAGRDASATSAREAVFPSLSTTWTRCPLVGPTVPFPFVLSLFALLILHSLREPLRLGPLLRVLAPLLRACGKKISLLLLGQYFGLRPS
ncbi:hypothetical protein DFH08DRAFT_124533 [Mycena albidolilacea]|uniref:Transmembrane protein n=1 Tax=Mycena albidolilacea TaxID=1033008 RepID=A0AAD7EU51_9AGAR|nr:hypothetical protein DFH08DRAFT_124533 [Mycena albidolilacea]